MEELYNALVRKYPTLKIEMDDSKSIVIEGKILIERTFEISIFGAGGYAGSGQHYNNINDVLNHISADVAERQTQET